MIVRGPTIRSDIDELAGITDASLAVDSFQDQVLGMCTIVFNYCTGLSLAFGTYNSLPSRKRTLVSNSPNLYYICSNIYVLLNLSLDYNFFLLAKADLVENICHHNGDLLLRLPYFGNSSCYAIWKRYTR